MQRIVIALTNQAGEIVESFTYDNHYGIITNHIKTIDTNNPYGYTARVVDTPELYYYRARYYDPTLQRFISQDPIGFASGDFNWYRYVGDSPVEFRDPWGLCAWYEWLWNPIGCSRKNKNKDKESDNNNTTCSIKEKKDCRKQLMDDRNKCIKKATTSISGATGQYICIMKATNKFDFCEGRALTYPNLGLN